MAEDTPKSSTNDNSTKSSTTSTPVIVTNPSSNDTSPLISLNASSQIPFKLTKTGENYGASTLPHDWAIDTGATHHITSDLDNLSLHTPYAGSDDVTVGNGAGIPITHIGSTVLSSPHTSFSLNNVLCAPDINQNRISVFKFCRQN